MKAAGMIFIIASAGSVGFRIAAFLKKRCGDLRQLYSALQMLYSELSLCVTPLPRAFALMAASCGDGHKRIFSAVAHEMEQSRWMTPKTAMERALSRYPDDLTGETLLELAGKLGKYDLSAQLNGIETAQRSVEQLLDKLETERSVKSKTYKTLSICAGLAAVILLL